jgi:hypothetical protein
MLEEKSFDTDVVTLNIAEGPPAGQVTPLLLALTCFLESID